MIERAIELGHHDADWMAEDTAHRMAGWKRRAKGSIPIAPTTRVSSPPPQADEQVEILQQMA